MSERDYSKQVAKRQRIRRSSLVVGVDVGKTYNAVGFMNKEARYWVVVQRYTTAVRGLSTF